MTLKENTQSLSDFVTKYGSMLPEVLKDAVEPRYNFELESVFSQEQIDVLKDLGSSMPLNLYTPDGGVKQWRGPLPGQQHVIAAMVQAFQDDTRRLIVRGETGVGKTQIALMSLVMADRMGMDVFPALVTEPRRVTKQWRARTKSIVPDAITMTIANPVDVEIFAAMARLYRGKKRLFGFIPNSMISRGPGFRAAGRYVTASAEKDVDGFWKPKSIFLPGQEKAVGCPQCFTPMVGVNLEAWHKNDETISTLEDLERMVSYGNRLMCPKCGSPLFEEVRPIPPGKSWEDRSVQFDVGEYIVENWKRLSRKAGGSFAQSMVIDELHKVFNMGSIRGATVMNLSRKVDYLLGLGASIYSGKASSIFWIYMMFNPDGWREWGPLEKATNRWEDELSNQAIIEKRKLAYYRSQSTGQKSKVAVPKFTKTKKELPSAPPRLVKMLAPNTIHVKLQHLGIKMPPLELSGIKVQLDPQHQKAYDSLMKEAYRLAQQKSKGGVAAAYLQTALTYPVAPWQEMEVGDIDSEVFPPDYICAPERAMLDFCEQEKNDGRKTIVYVTHTDMRNIVPRLITILGDRGIDAARPPKSLDTDELPAWLANEAVKNDVCILQEKAVEGVDAIGFQNILFYELDYSVWPVQQAAGRHWRLGQTEKCKTVFLEIEKTMLHRTLGLVMQGICSASQIYGDEIDAQVGKFNKGTLLAEAMRQELAGADLPNLDELYKKTASVLEKGLSEDEPTVISDLEDAGGSAERGTEPVSGTEQGAAEEGGDALEHSQAEGSAE